MSKYWLVSLYYHDLTLCCLNYHVRLLEEWQTLLFSLFSIHKEHQLVWSESKTPWFFCLYGNGLSGVVLLLFAIFNCSYCWQVQMEEKTPAAQAGPLGGSHSGWCAPAYGQGFCRALLVRSLHLDVWLEGADIILFIPLPENASYCSFSGLSLHSECELPKFFYSGLQPFQKFKPRYITYSVSEGVSNINMTSMCWQVSFCFS